MLTLAMVSICLRLALLARSPAPVPSGSDDFAYILLADTLRHLRLANPPHALPQFFQQIFVLQQPTYSSMFNLGQGLALAVGWTLIGNPWAGVLLSIGALCALSYWMLRAWIAPSWAFAGGLLAIMQFGPLSYWTNSYWGGAVSACAGCLVFGSLPRLSSDPRKRYALLLGLGLAVQLLTRPYEFVFLFLSVLLFLPVLRDKLSVRKLLSIASLGMSVLICAGALLIGQNTLVTGRWNTAPYLLYRFNYGVPATFAFEQNPVPHTTLNQEQELDYKAETSIHGDTTDSPGDFVKRLLFRLRFYRFFFFAPLYLPSAVYLIGIRLYRNLWVALTISLFVLGSNFYPYFYPHYIAAITCLFLLMSVAGLKRLNEFRSHSGAFLLCLCLFQFLVSYSIHAFAPEQMLSDLGKYESWDFVNPRDPQGRQTIADKLKNIPGKLLVFVHYSPVHGFEEWVHNEANVDSSRVVWVHDLGPGDNQKIQQYYPDRTSLLLKPDEKPPALTAYPSQTTPFKDVQ